MEEDRSKVPKTDSDERPESLASHGTNDHALITSHKPAAEVGEETDENSLGGKMEGDTLEDRAVRFLLNSSVSDLDLSQKLYFLESKGFTSPQIQSILHQLRTVQNGHLEETFQKTFGVSSIATPTPTRVYNNGMNFISPTNHQNLVQHHNVNGGGGNIAIIGLISGIATMVGMAGWRWLNGGDFELIPPPRIISKIIEQEKMSEANETHHYAESKSNEADIDDDCLGMNFYSNENNSADVLKKKEEEDIQEEEKRIKSRALTNSAMDYLLRRKNSSHGVENNTMQLTVQDQLLSMEEKLSTILDSVKAKASSNDADRQKSEHETIAKLEQMKMLLSTINNLPCMDDGYIGIRQSTEDAQEEMIEQTHNVAINQAMENDQNMITADMQDNKHEDMPFSDNLSTRVPGNLSSCSFMPSLDTTVPSSTDIYSQKKEEAVLSNPSVASNDTSHFAQHDTSAPPNPKIEEENVLYNPTATLNDTNHTIPHEASAPPNPMVTFSFCKDDAVFVECVRQLLQHNNQSVPDVVTTLSTIQMYCNNILKYKDTHSSSRYCKIHTNNPIFKKYIQQTKGAVELLESIGFGKASWESNTIDISNALKWSTPSRWAAVDAIRGVDGADSCDREQNIPILDGLSYLRKVSEELNFIKQQISTRTA
jgi:hypothetical protein